VLDNYVFNGHGIYTLLY